MASVIHLPLLTPPLPKNWSPPEPSAKSISKLSQRVLLPVGPAYLAHVRRAVNNRTFEDDDLAEEERRAAEAGSASGLDGEDDLGVGDEEETEELLALDPKEWKKQDHYAVLGLSHLRYLATPDQIKIAHRKKVLKHHPDKKAGVAGDSNDDAFFKCIQKALEVLYNPERRRQFDSVDPFYTELEQDAVPSATEVKKATEKNPQAFFTAWRPVFEREARFSKAQPVPMLGEIDDSKEKVEGFYDFWYNFDSWRSFEYLDKEVNEGSDSRDDKRYTEKKNKSERARRKKEDTARLRNLVDVALGLDPRIKRIKQEEKEAREAKKKRNKLNGNASGYATPKSAADVEAERKRAEEDARKKEEEEKVAKEEAKKAKAAAANAAKKARRAARTADGAA
ncbi:DnaJ-domain-containing protein [Rickenella mellea]|uniref:DnaJ-domain-containing protein n=1 Tax=Rickenella mellea TaxID=50990 RepID=A0A4Y7PZ28_9AGAM|nr:DnaJ-domain-containing protein [Rickenella mellea]